MTKKFSLPILIMLFAAVFACLNGFGDDKEKHGFYVPRANEVLYGTWINTTYTGMSIAQKFVLHDWGYWQEYAKETDEFYVEGTYLLVDRWTDSEGNILYKGFSRMRNGLYPIFELDKINPAGTVWELIFAYDDFPTADAMIAKNPYYRIYYRESP